MKRMTLQLLFIITIYCCLSINCIAQRIITFGHNLNENTNNSILSWDLNGESLNPVAANFSVYIADNQVDIPLNVSTISEDYQYRITVDFSDFDLSDGAIIKLKTTILETLVTASQNYFFDNSPPIISQVEIWSDNDDNIVTPGDSVYLRISANEQISFVNGTIHNHEFDTKTINTHTIILSRKFSTVDPYFYEPLPFLITIEDLAGNAIPVSETTNSSSVHYQVNNGSSNVITAPDEDYFCHLLLNTTITGSSTSIEIDGRAFSTSSSIEVPTEGMDIHWEVSFDDGPWNEIPNSSTDNLYIEAVPTSGSYRYRRVISYYEDSDISNDVEIEVFDVESQIVNLYPLDSTYDVNATQGINLSTSVDSDQVTIEITGNGVVSNQFFSNQAGVGQHIIHYRIYDEHCEGNYTKTLYVNDEQTALQLNASYCQFDLPINLQLSGQLSGFSGLTLSHFSGKGVVHSTHQFDPTRVIEQSNVEGEGVETLIKAYFTDSDYVVRDSIAQNVTVYKPYRLHLSVLQDTLFLHSNVQDFTISANVGALTTPSINYYLDDVLVSTTPYNFSAATSGIGTYRLKAIFTDPNSCETADDLIIKVTSPPNVPTPTTIISAEDSLSLLSLYTEMNIPVNVLEPIRNWDYFYTNTDGKITGLLLFGLGESRNLPDQIAAFKDLEVLKIYNTHLTTISDSLWHLPNLWLLDLSFNLLEDEDIEGVNNLPALRTFWVHHNKLTKVPKVKGMTTLHHLFANHNEINKVENNLNNVPHLKKLDLSFNQLVDMHESLENKDELEYLNLRHNKFTEWDYPLNSTLVDINLSDNLLESIQLPASIHQASLMGNKLFFNDLENIQIQNIHYSNQKFDLYHEVIQIEIENDYIYELQNKIDRVVYTWYKDNVQIGDSLFIQNASNLDGGRYVCIATHPNWTSLIIEVAVVTIGIGCNEINDILLLTDRRTSFCAQEEILLSVNSIVNDNNVFYNWYNNDELLSTTSKDISLHETGNYHLQVTSNNGCIYYSDTVVINQSDTIATPKLVYRNDRIEIVNIDTTKYYSWYYNNELIAQIDTFIYPSNLGEYKVISTNNTACNSAEGIINISDKSLLTSLYNQLITIGAKVYPIPSSDIITVELSNLTSVNNVTFHTLTGKSFDVGFSNKKNQLLVDVHHLKVGVYIMELSVISKKKFYQKIIIN
ncbi:hypothetical protein EI427_20695 [Flammeovirga pectinis]|uniref:Ig-like domain-containing protein n=1 Tax=Flammeovirga pectinis TaxID=2494373 RepID=A0A3Q9FP55_9BACT|nr:T9SS type A sorting domain-containing protein [Flammeovirga pectinis]AZQ64645.1 hypothetical protein EI427_20695 [Flammeovirga pectinis]